MASGGGEVGDLQYMGGGGFRLYILSSLSRLMPTHLSFESVIQIVLYTLTRTNSLLPQHLSKPELNGNR